MYLVQRKGMRVDMLAFWLLLLQSRVSRVAPRMGLMSRSCFPIKDMFVHFCSDLPCLPGKHKNKPLNGKGAIKTKT